MKKNSRWANEKNSMWAKLHAKLKVGPNANAYEQLLENTGHNCDRLVLRPRIKHKVATMRCPHENKNETDSNRNKRTHKCGIGPRLDRG